ncbi:hypothetical protein BD626DRAFT_385605, partial [Schizophyllum amplum]
YKPYRSAAIGFITPLGNVLVDDPRPDPEDLMKVAPAGARCGATGQSNKGKNVQVSHAADRATCVGDLRSMEIAFGMKLFELNLDTRPNLIFLTADMHVYYDRGLITIIPLLPVLNKLFIALTEQTLDDWAWDKPPQRNSRGFIHHEDVFEFSNAGRKFRLVPLSTWGTETGIQIMTKRPDGTFRGKLYNPPFTTPTTRKPQLPLTTLHCSPYFAVWKAYWAINQPDVVWPSYVEEEMALILQIGEIM